MTAVANRQAMHPDSYDFLLFRLGNFLLGAAAEQVIHIRRRDVPHTHSDRRQVNLKEIFQMIPDTPSETVLEIEHPRGQVDVLVDAAEGTINLNVDQIRKLPVLIDIHKSHPALWGLAILDEKIVFLLDLDLLEPEEETQSLITSAVLMEN